MTYYANTNADNTKKGGNIMNFLAFILSIIAIIIAATKKGKDGKDGQAGQAGQDGGGSASPTALSQAVANYCDGGNCGGGGNSAAAVIKECTPTSSTINPDIDTLLPTGENICSSPTFGIVAKTFTAQNLSAVKALGIGAQDTTDSLHANYWLADGTMAVANQKGNATAIEASGLCDNFNNRAFITSAFPASGNAKWVCTKPPPPVTS